MPIGPYSEPSGWPSDLTLVHAVRRGDRRAAGDLAQRLACLPAMVRARERRLATSLSEEERKEIVQNSVTALWSKLDRYRGRTPIEAWAWGFVLREHYKALERRHRSPIQASDRVIFGRTQDPEVIGDDYRTVHDSIQALGPPGSDIVRLKHFEGLTFTEIARELEMPTNTVKTRYYRCIERLRTLLRPLWKEVAE